ncbi:hypothetical protein AAY473_011466 [Plecturocebus cupreus]
MGAKLQCTFQREHQNQPPPHNCHCCYKNTMGTKKEPRARTQGQTWPHRGGLLANSSVPPAHSHSPADSVCATPAHREKSFT